MKKKNTKTLIKLYSFIFKCKLQMHFNCIRIQMGFVTFWSVFTHLNNTER